VIAYVLFILLTFTILIWKHRYIRFVFQHLPEPNRACLVGVFELFAVTLDRYFPYME